MIGFHETLRSPADRVDILNVVEEFRAGTVPPIKPNTLSRHHHLRKVDHPWAHGHVYLDPYPAELALRSVV
ncbi:MAG: DUF1722 domain-containing protein [Gemmatimonadetes bacterium]|nr:DUF1722 domain-containing protein [Gemmatimonadota bacterium]